MLIYLKHSLLFFLGFLFASCSSTRELPQKALFPFEYEDEAYQIISITSPDGEGMNFLIKVHNDTSVFRTLDQDQDGIIELVQYGPVGLEEANLIYHFGIRKAIDDGKFKSRGGERIFKYSEDQHLLTIQTFGIYTDLLYNKFTIRHSQDKTAKTFIDVDADGILDHAEIRDLDVQTYQPFYQKILDQGIKEGLIELKFEKFIVKVAADSLPS